MAATFGDLTTIDDVRSWLTAAANVTPPPISDNDMIERLITSASDFIKQWLGRPLAAQDWIETRDGQGTPTGKIETRVQFAAYPVTAVLSVKILNQTIPAIPPDKIGVNAGYLFSPTQLIIRGYHVPRLAQCIEVQYTAGFPVPPQALAQACIEFVAFKYRERQHWISCKRDLGGANQYHWGCSRKPHRKRHRGDANVA
jgi:hypothetical protein